MSNEPYHFFLSIPAMEIIAGLIRKYPYITRHLKEISRWTEEPHVTILGFNSYVEPYVVKAAISEWLLSCRIAPICLTLDGYRGGSAGQTQVLLFDKNDNKELRKLREGISKIVRYYVVHEGTFKKYLNHLCPIFHIAIGRTMSHANLDTLASSVRGMLLETGYLKLEIRRGTKILEKTPVYIGMKKGVREEVLYRIVYSTSTT